MEDGLRVENLQYKYKIFNNGPSTIKELSLILQVPLIYIPKPNYHIKIVEFDEIDIRGSYTNKVYEATWTKDDKIWLQSQTEGEKPQDSSNNMNLNNNFDTSKLGYDYDLNSDKTQEYDNLGHSHHRRKRSPWKSGDDYEEENIYRVYNQYTGSIDEYSSSYRTTVDREDTTLMNLPKNRTIFLDCSSPDSMAECIEAQFTVHNFRPGSEPITISMNFSIDLAKFGKNYLNVLLVSILMLILTSIYLYFFKQRRYLTRSKIYSSTRQMPNSNEQVMKP